jgi:hypothetical protein
MSAARPILILFTRIGKRRVNFPPVILSAAKNPIGLSRALSAANLLLDSSLRSE